MRITDPAELKQRINDANERLRPIREARQRAFEKAASPDIAFGFGPKAYEQRAAKLIGRRVVLSHLMHGGPFLGEIVAIRMLGSKPWDHEGQPVVSVKLDRQEEPVHNVLFFAQNPGNTEIPSAFWQVCWPEFEEL